jgi:hypothetical protein
VRVELRGVVTDTSGAAERRMTEGLASRAPEERLAMTMSLCTLATELAIAGIRLREGDLPEPELRLCLARLRYDAALVARAEAHRARQAR